MIYIAIYVCIGIIYTLAMDHSWKKDGDGVSTWQEGFILAAAWPVFMILQLLSGSHGDYE